MPQFFFLAAFLYVLFRDRERLLNAFSNFIHQPHHPVSWNFLIVILIIFFSGINRIVHWDAAVNLSDFFPYFILLIPTYVIATCFKKGDAKVLAFLVFVESVVVILEWMFGVSTFDRSAPGYETFSGNGLAYFHRPLGISASSSHIASKLFVAWLLIDFYRLKEKFWWWIKLFFLAAIVLTFNRTVMLSVGLYLVLRELVAFFRLKYTLENAVVGLVSMVVGLVGLVVVVVTQGERIINQLTRNKGTIELTGREYIWADFLDFISNHLMFGNNSVKLWLDGVHAHNSYIEVVATNGVFIALLYFILIYRNIKSSNWVYAVPIIIFGLTQYAFFWGISLFDIFFWIILFQIPERKTTLSDLLVGQARSKTPASVPARKTPA